MKKILITLTTLLIILVTTDRVFTWFFTNYFFSKTQSGDSGGAVNYLMQKKKNVDFIILGSSRAKHHINPALLSNLYNGNGYNAGINGTGGIIYSNMLLQLLVSKGIKPKMILLQTDPYPYFIADKDEDVTNELLPLYPFINESSVLKEFINKNTAWTERFKLLFHSYRYNGTFFRVLFNYAKRNSITDNNGFEGLLGKIDTTGFKITGDLNKTYSFSQLKLNTLTDVIQTCRANNIKLAVVFSPAYKNNIFLKQGYNVLIELLHKNNVTSIYNFSDIENIPSLQTPDMWRNATHLNSNGAKEFSRILNDSISSMK